MKPFALESGVLGRDVINDESDMAVAVAEIVGIRAAAVHGQFDLKGSGFVVEVDKPEIVEGESAGDVQIKGATVEIERPLGVKGADHHVDGLCHRTGPFYRRRLCCGANRVGRSSQRNNSRRGRTVDRDWWQANASVLAPYSSPDRNALASRDKVDETSDRKGEFEGG